MSVVWGLIILGKVVHKSSQATLVSSCTLTLSSPHRVYPSLSLYHIFVFCSSPPWLTFSPFYIPPSTPPPFPLEFVRLLGGDRNDDPHLWSVMETTFDVSWEKPRPCPHQKVTKKHQKASKHVVGVSFSFYTSCECAHNIKFLFLLCFFFSVYYYCVANKLHMHIVITIHDVLSPSSSTGKGVTWLDF